MVYLHMDPSTFSMKRVKTVKAAYASLDEAKAQAEHNLERGTQRPVRIEDDAGNVLVTYKD